MPAGHRSSTMNSSLRTATATRGGQAPLATSVALEERPFLPLTLGAILAGGSLAALAYFAYHGWYVEDISKDLAYAGIGVPFTLFALGVYLFAYAWERRDVARALRLTLIICVVSVVAIAAAIVILALLAKAKGGATVVDAVAGSSDEGEDRKS